MGEVQSGRGVGERDKGAWNMAAPCVCTENEIARISAHTFLGLPNLEWLDLSKNKLDARGLHPNAFKVRSSPSACSPRRPRPVQNGPRNPLLLPHPAWRIRSVGSTA